MRNINLFVEDIAHEDFLVALIQRLADEYAVEIRTKPSSVRGGHGTFTMEIIQLGTYPDPAACRPAAGSPAA